MTLQFDRHKIREALKDFYNATGIDMELLLSDFTPADPTRPHNCRYCDLVQSSVGGRKACHCSDKALLEACKATGNGGFQTVEKPRHSEPVRTLAWESPGF